MARILDIHPENPQPRLLAQAAGVLRSGGLIAYPTDSCYALGCSLDNKEGIERIIRLRRLDAKHHFTLMCRDFAQLGQFVEVDNSAFRTIKSLTPGPYTFILRATKEVPRRMMHPKKHSVGARIPDHRVAQGLVEEMGEPILSSTLLMPGEETPLTQAWMIDDEIGHALDAIIESDEPGTEPTSVIDFTDGRDPIVVREGAGDISRLSERRQLDREIGRLAIPALGALIAEPIFLLTDTAMVGHLGAEAQAGLAIASTVLQTVLGLMIFLAYATTPRVARLVGAGDLRAAVGAGIDGLWLALGIGILMVAIGLPLVDPVIGAFSPPSAGVSIAAGTYLAISLAGLPAMLMVIAGTGLLRGLQDTRTPLLVAGAGCLVNIVLNAILIYGLGLGIAGSAWGTVATQWGMLAVYLLIAGRAARHHGSPLRPDFRGVGAAAAMSGWLLLRNAALRIAMLATVLTGTAMGVEELAALQIVMTIFATIALALDALAIAGQAMIGHGLGAGDAPRVHAITRRLLFWGLWSGLAAGVVLAVAAPVIGPVFSPDPGVQAVLPLGLWALAVGLPIAGYVFVLDGVLMGAGDARFIALASVGSMLAYLPMLWLVSAWDVDAPLRFAALALAFGLGYMLARAVPQGIRARGDRWIVTGARR